MKILYWSKNFKGSTKDGGWSKVNYCINVHERD